MKIPIVGVIVFFSLAILFVVPFFGSHTILPSDIFGGDGTFGSREIFWRIRVPRTILAFLSGSALAVSGLAFQAIFRNPLATPFTLGVSSGASFGAALYVCFGVPFTFMGISGTSIGALLGSVLAIFLVYGATRLRRGLSTTTMLLAGVAVSFCFTSAILFLQYTTDFAQSFRIVRWLMGGLEVVGFDSTINVLPFVVVGVAVLYSLSHDFNLMSTGEDIATSRGVNVVRTKNLVFFSASIMVGGVVSVCGPIGFIGMMAPHICRLLVGWEHRTLIPVTIVFGGAFLAICDTVARVVIAPAEIPVGVITAMIGGPFFLWLLLSGVSARIR